MRIKFTISLCLLQTSLLVTTLQSQTKVLINPEGMIVQTRFTPPKGFVRENCEELSFENYLRNLRLKPDGSPVRHFDGSIKPYDVFDAVVDLPIGNKNLHQCADALIRLRADFLRSQGRVTEIHFNLTNGFRVDYSKWLEGYRVKEKNNKTWWELSSQPSLDNDQDYWEYLELIFYYAGSYSLSKELKPINISDIKIGDVFIYGGFPGHAVMVIDLAFNPSTGKKVVLLAQSYMPAQEIQILKNMNDVDLSPWFEPKFSDGVFFTPEWTFYQGELKRF